MNRTSLFLGAAAALLALAFLLGNSKATTTAPPSPLTQTTSTQTPPLSVTVAPAPAIAPGDVSGSLRLEGKLSHPVIFPGQSEVFAVLDISAVDVPGAARAPVNSALVIDRSGSMAGAKLVSAKRAAERYIDLLQPTDRLAIVSYSNDAEALTGRFATAENKQAMRRFIHTLTEGGGTNLEAGLRRGRAELLALKGDFSANRMLVLSDGQPTLGATSSNELTQLAAQLHAEGFSVTAMGIGADVNETLMDQVAQVGGGAYGFVSTNDSASLQAFFEKDFSQASTMVARNASLLLTLPANVEVRDVFGRTFTNNGREVLVALNDFSARQHEKVTLRLSAATASATALDIGRFSLRYEDVLSQRPAQSTMTLSALVSSDPSLVNEKRDKEAFVQSTRALTGMNLRRAAEALAIGRTEEAQQVLLLNDGLLDAAQDVGGAAAVAQDRKDNATVFGLASAPASAPQRQEQAKSLKKQALKTFGRGDSVY